MQKIKGFGETDKVSIPVANDSKSDTLIGTVRKQKLEVQRHERM